MGNKEGQATRLQAGFSTNLRKVFNKLLHVHVGQGGRQKIEAVETINKRMTNQQDIANELSRIVMV